MASGPPPARVGALVSGEIIEKMVLHCLASARKTTGGSNAAGEALAK